MPTMKDVADRCGVSISTVSRVLNRRPGIHVSTRERVLKAAKELGFQPNAPARALAGGGTCTIGLMVSKVSEPYYAGVLLGASHMAEKHGYHLLFGDTNDRPLREVDPVGRFFTQGRVDGLIIVGGFLSDREYITDLAEKGLPYVLVEWKLTDPRVNCIDVDNISGAYVATNHLLDLGHRRIAHLAGDPNIQQTLDRIVGYGRALHEAGLATEEDLQACCYFDRELAYKAMKRLLLLSNPPTAVFAADDDMAIGAIAAILDEGLQVPQDLAVVGFDDIKHASWFRPTLTTVRQPSFEMGETAVEILVRELEEGSHEKEKKILPLELVIRQSCGAIANSR